MPSEIYGYFFVCDDVFETDNIITPAQVSIATGKGWIVKKLMKDDIYGSYYAGFGDVNGDDYIDQYDLDTIVNIIPNNLIKPFLECREFESDFL